MVVVVVVVSVLYHYIAIGLTNVHFTGDYTAIQTGSADSNLCLQGGLTGAEKCINDNVRDERDIIIISYLHTIVYCTITSSDKKNITKIIQKSNNQSWVAKLHTANRPPPEL